MANPKSREEPQSTMVRLRLQIKMGACNSCLSCHQKLNAIGTKALSMPKSGDVEAANIPKLALQGRLNPWSESQIRPSTLDSHKSEELCRLWPCALDQAHLAPCHSPGPAGAKTWSATGLDHSGNNAVAPASTWAVKHMHIHAPVASLLKLPELARLQLMRPGQPMQQNHTSCLQWR